MDWPALSPDMNPVENAWAIMKQEVEKRLPTTLDQLKLIIQDVWENLETQNLCLSHPEVTGSSEKILNKQTNKTTSVTREQHDQKVTFNLCI